MNPDNKHLHLYIRQFCRYFQKPKSEYLLSLDILVDLSRDWPAELQALSAGYPATEYAVEISGTAFAREHGISDEPVYLCMFANGHGYQRGLDIAAYILENG